MVREVLTCPKIKLGPVNVYGTPLYFQEQSQRGAAYNMAQYFTVQNVTICTKELDSYVLALGVKYKTNFPEHVSLEIV